MEYCAVVNIQNDAKLLMLDRITVAGVKFADAESVIGQRVLLYGTRGCSKHGYFGTATLVRTWRDREIDSRVFVSLENRQDFPHVVPFGIPENHKQEKDLGQGIPPWPSVVGLWLIDWRYYEAILKAGFPGKSVDSSWRDETGKVNFLAEPPQAAFSLPIEERQRETIERLKRANFRQQVMLRDKRVCYLSHATFEESMTSFFLDVSHLHPLGHGGPDVTPNMVLMRKEVHAAWENGFVTVGADGQIIYAADIPAVILHSFEGQTKAHVLVLTDTEREQTNAYLAFHRGTIFRGTRRHGP